MTEKEQQFIAEKFVNNNLQELCVELYAFHEYSGTLPENSRIRQLVGLCAFANHSDLGLAENMIKMAAVKKIVFSKILHTA